LLTPHAHFFEQVELSFYRKKILFVFRACFAVARKKFLVRNFFAACNLSSKEVANKKFLAIKNFD